MGLEDGDLGCGPWITGSAVLDQTARPACVVDDELPTTAAVKAGAVQTPERPVDRWAHDTQWFIPLGSHFGVEAGGQNCGKSYKNAPCGLFCLYHPTYIYTVVFIIYCLYTIQLMYDDVFQAIHGCRLSETVICCYCSCGMDRFARPKGKADYIPTLSSFLENLF